MEKKAPGTTRSKVLISVVFILIGVLSSTNMINMAFGRSVFRSLEEKSSIYLDDTLKKAIYTYAIVRGINGVISVLQNSSVAMSPAGIGINMALGEVLDPINDLMERFSWVMLVSIAAIGIQKIFLSLGTWLGLNILLSLSMIILLVGIWIPHSSQDLLKKLGIKLVGISIVVWLCIPVVTIVGDIVYDLFLREKYDTASQSLDLLHEELKDADIVSANPLEQNGETGLLDDVINYYEEARDSLNISSRINELKHKLSNFTEHTINLIIVFLAQTVILPLLFLWMFIRLSGSVFSVRHK